MLKDYKHVVNQKVINKMVEMSMEDNNNDFELLWNFEGSLLDEYVFINYDYQKGAGVYFKPWHKPRKYIIIYEKYVNEWTSENVAIETNNEQEYKNFLNQHKEEVKQEYGY